MKITSRATVVSNPEQNDRRLHNIVSSSIVMMINDSVHMSTTCISIAFISLICLPVILFTANSNSDTHTHTNTHRSTKLSPRNRNTPSQCKQTTHTLINRCCGCRRRRRHHHHHHQHRHHHHRYNYHHHCHHYYNQSQPSTRSVI